MKRLVKKCLKEAGIILAGSFFLLVCALSLAEAQVEKRHSIDNLSTSIGILGEPLVPEEPIHNDGVFTEGQVATDCTLNPQKYKDGRTLNDISRKYWHWRRHIVNKLLFLSGWANRAKAEANLLGKTNAKIPFYDYDPFFRGDTYHPELIADWNTGLGAQVFGPYAWDGLQARYDYFLEAQKLNDDSFLVDFPAKAEGAFIYWDRIPAHPIADACMLWKEGNMSFDSVLQYAADHELAAIAHLRTIEKRIVYMYPLLVRRNY